MKIKVKSVCTFCTTENIAEYISPRSKDRGTRIHRESHPRGPLIPLLSSWQTPPRTPTKQTLTSTKFCIEVSNKSGARSFERTFFPPATPLRERGFLPDRLTCRKSLQLPLIKRPQSATFRESIALRLARRIDRYIEILSISRRLNLTRSADNYFASSTKISTPAFGRGNFEMIFCDFR